MIKVDSNSIEVSGTYLDLLEDLAIILKTLGPEKQVFTKELLHRFVDGAFMSKEELEAEQKRSLDRIIENLGHLASVLHEDCENCPEKDDCDISKCKGSKAGDTFGKLFNDLLGE